MKSTLLTRLALATVAVAAAATVATAYLTSITTSDRIERDASRSLDADIRVRDALLEHALASGDWSDVGPLVSRLAAASGRHVTLTTPTGALVADAEPDGSTSARSLPERVTEWPNALGDPAALIDPIATVAGDQPLSPVVLGDVAPDPAAGLVVPDLLVRSDDPAAIDYRSLTAEPLSCLDPSAGTGTWGPVPSLPTCDASGARVDNDYVELQGELAGRVVECATASGAAAWVGFDAAGVARVVVDAAPSSTARVRGCTSSVRADVFGGTVAPAVLLYLAEPAAADDTSWVERAGGARIVLALLAVLAVALVAAIALAARIVRPLRRLTHASRELAHGRSDARVHVHGADELAQLGTAFNEMADALARADRQRRNLVSDVAHELRTPLTVIHGYLEGAQDGVVPTDATLIDSLLEETRHVRRVVDDLQDVALAEAGQLRLTIEPVDLAAVLDAVVQTTRGTATSRGVALVSDVPGDVSATGDAMRLRQVFANLLHNALRHTPAGGTVRIAAAMAAQGDVVITVTDSGEGIAAAHLPHVFDRFYRTDPSRSRESGGTGLGLAICKQLVEAHGGSIGVHSEPGHGTTFTVTLPAAPAGAPASGASEVRGGSDDPSRARAAAPERSPAS